MGWIVALTVVFLGAAFVTLRAAAHATVDHPLTQPTPAAPSTHPPAPAATPPRPQMPAPPPAPAPAQTAPEESATITDDPTTAPDSSQSADNNVSFPTDI
jgi:hypothetical protein